MTKSTLFAALAVLLAGSLSLAQSVEVKEGCGGCSGDGCGPAGVRLVHGDGKVGLTVTGGWGSLPEPVREALLRELGRIMCEGKLKTFLARLEAGAETAEIDVCGRTDHDVAPGGCEEEAEGGCGEGGAEGGGCGGPGRGEGRLVRIRKVGEGDAVGDPSGRLFVGLPGNAGEPRRMVLLKKEALPGQVEVEVEEWASEPGGLRVYVAGHEGWDRLPPEVRKELLEHLKIALPPEEMKRVLEALGKVPPRSPDCGCGGRAGDPVVRALEELTREVRALREEIRRAHGGPAPFPRDERDRELAELRMQFEKMREHLDLMGRRLRELTDR